MWSRQDKLVDFHLYTNSTGDDAPQKSVHLLVTHNFISGRRYLKHVGFDEDEIEQEELLEKENHPDNGNLAHSSNGKSQDNKNDSREELECSTYLNEEALKGELTSNTQKLANRLSTIYLADFDLSSDSDASDSGKLKDSSQTVSGGHNHTTDRLKKYLDEAASLNRIREETSDLVEEEEKTVDADANDEAAMMAAMGLPLCFGGSKSKGEAMKKKISEKEIKKRFTRLWEHHGELMVYKSFVSIYPDYAGLYDEITGSIPACVEIEITDNNGVDEQQVIGCDEVCSENLLKHDVSTIPNTFSPEISNNEVVKPLDHGKGDSQIEDGAIKQLDIENSFNIVHSVNDKGDFRKDCLDIVDNGRQFSKNVGVQEDEDVEESPKELLHSHDDASREQVESVKEDITVSTSNSKSAMETSKNDDHESRVIFTESHVFSKPLQKKDCQNLYDHSSYRAGDHSYSANESADGGDCTEYDGGQDYHDENYSYTHEDLIEILKGTHEDLRNEIYWHVKDKVGDWYRSHPNKKFDISSLDEDLMAISEPYIQQEQMGLEESEEYCNYNADAFYVGEGEDNCLGQDDDDENRPDEEEEDAEELISGSFTGEKIYDSIEALGLSLSRDTEGRKRKIDHGTIVVNDSGRVGEIIQARRKRRRERKKKKHEQETPECSWDKTKHVRTHILFDDDGNPIPSEETEMFKEKKNENDQEKEDNKQENDESTDLISSSTEIDDTEAMETEKINDSGKIIKAKKTRRRHKQKGKEEDDKMVYTWEKINLGLTPGMHIQFDEVGHATPVDESTLISSPDEEMAKIQSNLIKRTSGSDDSHPSRSDSPKTTLMSRIGQSPSPDTLEVNGVGIPMSSVVTPERRPYDKGPVDQYHSEIFAQDPKLKKYWVQRFRLFSKFNKGIKMDREGWYSVTPEAIAAYTAYRLKCDVVLDAFCGAGGNTIQFAKVCKQVIAVDINESRLELARHNAKIYGVEDKIRFIHADFRDIVSELKADVVFLSPPWGGPDYINQDPFDIENMNGISCSSLINLTRKISNKIAIYLPKNTDVTQVADLAGNDDHVELEVNHLDAKVKFVTVYLGGLTKRKMVEL